MVEPIADGHPSIAFPQEIDVVVDQLKHARIAWRTAHPHNDERGSHFPSRQALKRITGELGTALFPLRLGPSELTVANENAFIAASLESTLAQLAAQIDLELSYSSGEADTQATAVRTERLIGAFAAGLPAIRTILDSDVEAAYAADPAARSVDEVLVAYPSFTAIIHHRIAHLLYRLGAPLVARLIAEIAHAGTGIDIHPAATIGRRFFIDHGTGVVIGETAILGDRVRLYQGVTLGGDPDLFGDKSGAPRHPIVEDDVVIHANATVVGRVTIGARSRIGGGVWLRQDVPADTLVEAPPPVFRALPTPPADRA
ncbi:serine O-acetyltransferase EpsC [Sphingomonas melonis]|jgi:serine O-acetyltransferase|uniref:serine O-acetyltransferase n=1 Tax=Sphingomonas melonis TaxID=152682 RepID=A0A7Y9FMP0_9SPHN|nr:serine O-acetyltransferase EpsC [Sphingomonas melonis]NYD90128.1 serine O-acetyltransferase [Sphingomonas melonis]